jgi:coenzyme F420-0:L-glutamate ligase/coenzyme F420-1:gamma-L-glutamate ligase
VTAVCFAHGWTVDGWRSGDSDVVATVSPATP